MKKTLIGLVAACFCAGSAFGTVTITAPSLTVTADTAENAAGGGSYTPLGNIVITEGANTDFANNQTGVTLILPAPSGWIFNNNALTVTTAGPRDFVNNSWSAVATSNAITVTFSVSSVSRLDSLTISGIEVKPQKGTNFTTATIVRPTGTSGGTSAVLGTTNSVFATLKQVPGAATKLAIQTQPSTNATAGVAFAQQPVLLVQDQFGSTRNTANGASDSSTTVTASRNAGAGTLQGTLTQTAANGVVTFSGLNHQVATNISITFTGAGTNVTSGNIAVSAASVSRLGFATEPGTAIAGTTISPAPVVRTQDAYGNNSVTGLGSSVTVTLALTSGTGTLQGTTSRNIGTGGGGGNGVLTFSNLQLNSAGTNKQLTASATGFTSGVSAFFTVNPAAASTLSVQTQPSATATAGAPFGTQPAVQLLDSFGNIVTTNNGAVITASAVGGSGALQGSTSATAVNGIATFSGLNYQVAQTISLAFSSPGLTGTNSSSITVSPAAASTLVFTTSPGLSGSAFPVQPVVITKDAFGNISSAGLSATNTVTITLTSGTGTLQGTTTANIGSTGGNGSVTFSGLRIDTAGTNKQLTASAPGFTDGVSSGFTIQAAAGSKLTIQTPPSSTATAGVAFSTQPVIRVEDAFGNLISTNNSTIVSASRNAGTGILQGTTNVTVSGGIATFANLSHNVANTITLNFTASGLTTTTSSGIAVNPATASQIAFTTEPANAMATVPFGTQPVIKTKDQFGNLSSAGLATSQIVSIELASGVGPLGGTTNVDLGSLAGNGVATFTDLHVDSAGTSNRLNATSSGFSSVESAYFNVAGTDQTISFIAITNKVYGDAPFTATATASSGLPVTFTVLSGPATNSGDIITILGTGSVTVQATQAGNATFYPATTNQTFTVAPAILGITANNQSRQYGETNATLTYNVTGFVNGDSAAVLSGAPSLGTVNSSANTGAYPITISAGTLAAENYTFAFTNGSLSITSAPLTVTADAKTRVYGQLNPTFTAHYSGFVNGDDESVLVGTLVGSTSADTNSPVGVYPIGLSGVTATNYSIAFVDGALTITPYALVAVADSATNIYGAVSTTFTGMLNGVQTGDNITATFETTNVTATSVIGAYDIVPVLHDPNSRLTNYTVSSTNGVLTIAKATITVTADNQSRIYGNTNSDFTASYSGFVNGETNDVISGNPELTSTAGTNSAVGSYTITASIGSLSAANYEFAFVNGIETVLPASLTGIADNKVRIYGDANPAFTVTYSGFVNGEDASAVSGTLVGSTTATTNSPIGTYAISVSGQTATNYTISYVDGTLTVTPAVITVVAADASKVYGSTNPVFIGSLSGVRNVDQITAGYQSSANATTSVGTYDIAPILNDPTSKLTNYTVLSTNGALTITKATLTVTANSDTKIYGATNPVFSASYSDFQNADSTNVITGSPSFTVSPVENGVGSYAIVPALGTLSAVNYNFAFVNGTLTVTPASLTITADDKARPYGDSNPQFTATYAGFVNGDDSNVLSGTLSFNTLAMESSPVGSYSISVSGQSSPNYTITFVDGTLTIGKLMLTAAADNASRSYGSTNQIFTGTVSANADNITATFSSAATTNSPIGTYTIVPTFDDPNGKLTNYIVETSGTLTVTKAALVLTADVSRGYGAANPLITGNISGVQNNENITVAFSSETTTNTPVGAYTVQADLFATNSLDIADATMLDNYEITTNCMLTITNAPLVVTVDNALRGYGVSNPSFAGTISGIQNNENITANYSSTAIEISPVGTYPITATVSDNATGVLSNYNVSVIDGTLTISGGVITVVANNTNKIYGSENPEFTGTLSGAAVEDGITVSYTTIADTNSSVGLHTITPVLDDHGSGALTNYAVNATSGTLTITKAPLVITPVNKGVGAGTNTPALTATLNGVKNNDLTPANVTCVLSPVRAKLATILNYNIIVTNITDPSAKLANYTVTTNVGIFRVVDNVKIASQPVAAPKNIVQQGSRVVLTAKGTGIGVTYQWALNGNNIGGATGSTFVINTAQLSDAGIYTVGVSNDAGGILSNPLTLTVLTDSTIPSAAIIKPGNNSITSDTTNATGTIIACGTAADTARVTNVFYRLNGSAWTPVSTFALKDAAGLQAFWTNSLTAVVGTNVLEVYSADWTGNTSKVMNVTFFFHVASTLSVSIDEHDTRAGEGSDSAWKPDYTGVKSPALVVPPFNTPTNGAGLYVNRGPYTLTAIPGHNQIFSNWSSWITGSTTTNYFGTAKYTFVMQTNLNLKANFIHNPWMEAQGTYIGLFTNETTDIDISGGINLKVSTNLAFSGKVMLDGDSVSVSGVFKVDGTQLLTLSRAKLGKKPLTLSITNLFGRTGGSGTNQIVGTLTDGSKTAKIVADQWIYNGATTNPAKGFYTMILPKSESSLAPNGYGYASITVDAAAKVVAAGSLAEGSALAPQLGYVGKDGRWPMFNQIYATKLRVINYTNSLQFHTNSAFMGMYLGWVNLTNPEPQNLRWIKTTPTYWSNFVTAPVGVYTNYYTNGFSLDMPITVKSYSTNAGALARVINITNALVSTADGNLPTSPQTHQLRYGNDAKVVLLSGTNVVKVSTNAALGKLTLAFDWKTGKMTGSFTNGISLLANGAPKTIVISGAVLQPDNIAYGYFLGTNESGSVTFQVDPTNP